MQIESAHDSIIVKGSAVRRDAFIQRVCQKVSFGAPLVNAIRQDGIEEVRGSTPLTSTMKNVCIYRALGHFWPAGSPPGEGAKR